MSSPGNDKKNAIKERVSFKKVHEDSFKVRCMRKLGRKYNASFSYSETSVLLFGEKDIFIPDTRTSYLLGSDWFSYNTEMK